MAQKQLRVNERVYQELESIAKSKHCSVAEAGDWVLRLKLDAVQLADVKPGTKKAEELTIPDLPMKLVQEIFNSGWERGQQQMARMARLSQIPETKPVVKKEKPVWPHS